MTDDLQTAAFEQERPRLLRIATHVLGDPDAAQDVVQQAWLRLHGTTTEIDSLPAWLTTVTTRLCLDRFRARVPDPVEDLDDVELANSPADDVVLADTVGIALQVVLDQLTPRERVAFVLHDTFAFDFATIAEILDASPSAARKLASRARSKVVRGTSDPSQAMPADWEVVDAFMAAARGGDLSRLLALLAPDAVVEADQAAVAIGTPQRIEGRADMAAFFNGSAHTAFAAFVGDRPGAAWLDRGVARVAFDFTVVDGQVARIVFRAEPELLATVRRRDGAEVRDR